MKFKWTKERVQYLKDNYSKMAPDELVEVLGLKNKGSLYAKASELKIKREGYHYTEEEEDLIKENFSKMSPSELSSLLGRSVSQIYCKTSNMGLKNKTPWTEEEIELLKENYSKYSNEYLSKNIFTGRNPHSIRTMAFKFGLKTDRSFKQFDREEIISRLKEIYQETGKTPLGAEFKSLGLPSERTVARYFGSYEELCKIAGMPINMSFFGCACEKSVASDGSLCLSKSELIITEFLIKRGIAFTKEVPYRTRMRKEDCGLLRCDWEINGVFVEFFGMPEKEEYYKKMELKRELCKRYDIVLVELYRNDLPNLKEKLKDVIQQNP